MNVCEWSQKSLLPAELTQPKGPHSFPVSLSFSSLCLAHRGFPILANGRVAVEPNIVECHGREILSKRLLRALPTTL